MTLIVLRGRGDNGGHPIASDGAICVLVKCFVSSVLRITYTVDPEGHGGV